MSNDTEKKRLTEPLGQFELNLVQIILGERA